MINDQRRRAITLFEVLAMVVIVAVVAGTVIPQFLSSTNDPKSRSLEFNLHMVRSQIGRYQAQHRGKVPTLANFGDQMTRPTDAKGATTGTDLVYGP
jgi:type II secretory pathway pseudopilin PulG